MTISNTTNKVVYTGSGTSVFAYTFKVFASTDLVVQQYTIATGVTTTLVETTDYTVSGVGDAGGGNVTLTAGSFPSGLSSDYKIIINRSLPLTQTTDYVENDPFPAETHEEALDRAAMRDQQLQEQLDRSLLQDATQTSQITFPGASANKIIGWDSGGTTLENKTPTDISTAVDITLGASDAGKIIAVNATSDGYTVKIINDYTDTVITASDEILFGDASDSNNLKKDTVQGIVDLATEVDINGKTDTVITGSDEIIFSDADDSNNNKKDTVQGILDLVSSLSVFMTNINFNLSTASGTTVSSTGFGFQPTHLYFFTSVSGSANSGHSMGLDNGTFQVCSYMDSSGNWQHDANHSIRYDNGANVQELKVHSLDADGITFSNTKTGSPTGTMVIRLVAFG